MVFYPIIIGFGGKNVSKPTLEMLLAMSFAPVHRAQSDSNTLPFDFLSRKNVHYGLCEGFLKLWCLFVLSGRESVFKVYLDSFSWKFIISTKNVTLQNTCKPSTDAMSDSDTLPFDFLVRNDVPYGLPEGFIFYIYFSSHAAEKVILSCIFDVSHQKICLKTRILPENHQKKYF